MRTLTFLLLISIFILNSVFAQTGDKVMQQIDLKAGWNIISFNVIPDSLDMKAIFQPLIDDTLLVKVQDENGNALEDYGVFGGWTNNIGNISLTEGYKVKVIDTCRLIISGEQPEFPIKIPLKTGWNIIGYPCNTGYNGMSFVRQLIVRGSHVKTQDEDGNAIEDYGILGGWMNNIGNFKPGEGYKIKINLDDTLTMYEGYFYNSQVIINDTVIVNFPSGSILTAHPTVEKTSDGKLHYSFDLTSELFKVYNKISYQIKISIGEQPPQNELIEVLLNIPDDFMALVPSDYGIQLFALIYQNGGEETIESFELIPSTFNLTYKTLSAKLPLWIFTNKRNNHFETYLTIASTPGITQIKNASIEAYEEGDCEASPISCPLPSCEVTSSYNLYRVHPITGEITPHWGTDFRAANGTPVYAVGDGKVSLVKTQVDDYGNPTGYGLYIIIELDNNKGSVLYAHLSKSLVVENQTVVKNEKIAESDNSGSSTGPHLHFEYVPSGWIIQSKGRINPVSCISDEGNTIETGKITDSRDGHIYKTVKIGTQWWMAENLAYLPAAYPASNVSTSAKRYYVYGYNGNNVDQAKAAENYIKYGVIYNWSAAMNGESSSDDNPSGVKGICPYGWHLPSNSEWVILVNYMGGSEIAGGKMKSTTGWASPNVGATNSSGFTAVPGGCVGYPGYFDGLTYYNNWWSSKEYNSSDSFARHLHYNYTWLHTIIAPIEGGFSVRCIKD